MERITNNQTAHQPFALYDLLGILQIVKRPARTILLQNHLWRYPLRNQVAFAYLRFAQSPLRTYASRNNHLIRHSRRNESNRLIQPPLKNRAWPISPYRRSQNNCRISSSLTRTPRTSPNQNCSPNEGDQQSSNNSQNPPNPLPPEKLLHNFPRLQHKNPPAKPR